MARVEIVGQVSFSVPGIIKSKSVKRELTGDVSCECKKAREVKLDAPELPVHEYSVDQYPVSVPGNIKSKSVKRELPGNVSCECKKAREVKLEAPELPVHEYPVDQYPVSVPGNIKSTSVKRELPGNISCECKMAREVKLEAPILPVHEYPVDQYLVSVPVNIKSTSVERELPGNVSCECKKVREVKLKAPELPVHEYPVDQYPVSVSGNIKSTSVKRELPGNVSCECKKAREVKLEAQNLPVHEYPVDHPFNKEGYRYFLAEPDPHAPYKQESEESSKCSYCSSKPISGCLYRTVISGTVLLALHDRDTQLKISEDRLAVTGEKGYSTVRATHGVTIGTWYWEATIKKMPKGTVTRIGWGQAYANLQAPLGYDKFGYSWRSEEGTKFHESIGKDYSPGYGEGDTLGFMIILPQDMATKLLPNTYKDRPLVDFNGHLYYEEKVNVAERLKALKDLKESKIMFFKNGKCEGTAFKNIYQGTYFPTVSIYKSATVSVNFGPNFKYAPKADYNCKGMHQKAEESICEQTIADLIYLTENEGKLR